ncbi:MAG: hypothetical protein IJW16_01625 [Clostridia bacterium]|nr:hypothetical protein [Clostridia bacterium]
MNREVKNQAPQKAAPTIRATDETNDPSLHPVTRKNLKKTKKRLRILQIVMIVVVGLILITGLMLAIMPLCTVSEIVVEGNVACTAEEIIAASGIKEGDEIFSVFFAKSGGELQNQIFLACPNLRTIKISCGFSKVTITVTEMENVMYTSAGSEWYSLNTDLLVLEKNADPSAFSPFLKVKLPAVTSVTVGRKVAFANQNIDYGYIVELLEVFKRHDVMDSVTYVDFSDKLSLSCVFGDRIRLELGTLADTDTKFARFADVLREKGDVGYAVINVSNPSKPTYQAIESTELYD